MDLFLDFIEIFRRLMIILAQNKVSVYFCDSCSSITNALLYKQHNNNNNKFKWLRVFSIAANWGHNKGNINVRIISKYIITGASRRLEPVIKCCWFLSFFQCLVSRAPLSAVTESLS